MPFPAGPWQATHVLLYRSSPNALSALNAVCGETNVVKIKSVRENLNKARTPNFISYFKCCEHPEECRAFPTETDH